MNGCVREHPHWVHVLWVADEALERDFFMSAEEAKEFGIIDEVIAKREQLADQTY